MSRKIHYGFIYDCGDYESPSLCCDKTACGCIGEIPCVDATSDWNMVNCKKCLKQKDAIIAGDKADEEVIVNQMGDFVDFQNKTGKYATPQKEQP